MEEALAEALNDPMSASDRRGRERRRRRTPALSWYSLRGGRRAGERRGADSSGLYVDRYSAPLAAALVSIGALCALDAVFTLLYLQKGGTEANPIMEALIDRAGPRAFLVLKCLVTNLGLFVLCLHKNFPLVKQVIVGLVAVYGTLFLYHIYLATTIW